MPETFGKRKRRENQAKKAAARDDRRVARNQRRAERGEGGDLDWLGEPPPAPTEAEILAATEGQRAADE